MKKILFSLVFFLTFLSPIFAQGEYQALRFRQPLAFYQYLMRELHYQTADRDSSFKEALKSPDGMKRYIADLQYRLKKTAGPLPERRPIKAKTVDIVNGDGFSVEKIIYQASPGRYVTAHLYLPENINGKIPACVEMPGHSATGKGNGSAQASLMARNGIAVIVVDPLGQGERMQLIDKEGKNQTRGATTEHTLLNVPYILLGSSLAAQQFYDNSRAIDYLLSREEIDPDRIGCYGFSGGGTMASYLVALDDRIKCACIGLFFSSRLRTLELIGPSDGCQQMPFEGLNQIEGVDMVLAMAPCPVIILDGKYDFVDHWGALQGFDELCKAYKILGYPDRVSQYYAEDGHATPPDVQQKLINWFRKWLLEDSSPAKEGSSWRGNNMQCTVSGQINLEFSDAQSTIEASLKEMDCYETVRMEFCKKPLRDIQSGIRQILGITESVTPLEIVTTGQREQRGFKEYRYQLNRNGEFPVPVIVRIPDCVSEKSNIEIRLSDRGKGFLMAETDKADTSSDGTIIIWADLRGMGESSDPEELNLLKYWNKEYRTASLSLHIGRPLLGQRVVDVMTLLDFCEADPRLKNHPVRIMAEGNCGPVAAHATVLDFRIKQANLHRSLRTWKTYLENPLQYDMLSNVVPGVLRLYDLPDLVKLSEGRTVYAD